MPDTKFRRRISIIVPILSLAIVCAFALSAWSFYASHQQACRSRNATLTVLRDTVLLATTDDPTRPADVETRRRALAFRAAVFARISKARCNN